MNQKLEKLFITCAKARYLKNDQEKRVSQKANLSLVTSKMLRDRIVLYDANSISWADIQFDTGILKNSILK